MHATLDEHAEQYDEHLLLMPPSHASPSPEHNGSIPGTESICIERSGTVHVTSTSAAKAVTPAQITFALTMTLRRSLRGSTLPTTAGCAVRPQVAPAHWTV